MSKHFQAEFDWGARLASDDSRPINFTGEHIYPWMFDGDYSDLRPLKKASELLAAKSDWPALYDLQVLKDCQVPLAAAVYYQDFYVPTLYGEETAEILGQVLHKCSVLLPQIYMMDYSMRLSFAPLRFAWRAQFVER
eukprot:SAG31_NODE_1821_length_7194_cov_11.104863_3_plen_137_part_00